MWVLTRNLYKSGIILPVFPRHDPYDRLRLPDSSFDLLPCQTTVHSATAQARKQAPVLIAVLVTALGSSNHDPMDHYPLKFFHHERHVKSI